MKFSLVLLLLCNLHGSSPLGLKPPTSLQNCCSAASSSSSSSSSAPSSSSFAGIKKRASLVNLRAAAAAFTSLSLSSSSAADDNLESIIHSSSSTADASTTSLDDNIENDDERRHQQQHQLDQNTKYINGLLSNLETTLDKWIVTGSMATRRHAYNILQQVERLSMDADLYRRAERLVKRSGMSMDPPPPVENPEHVPATDQTTHNNNNNYSNVVVVAAAANDIDGNNNNSNNDRRFKNMYAPPKSDDGLESSSSSSSCGGYEPIKTGQNYYSSPTTYSSSSSSSAHINQANVVDEQTGNNRRISIAEERLQWEQQQKERNSLENHYNSVSGIVNKANNNSNNNNGGSSSSSSRSKEVGVRSALSARMKNSKEGGDPFVSSMVEGGSSSSSSSSSSRGVDDLVEFAEDKRELQRAMSSSSSVNNSAPTNEEAAADDNNNIDFGSVKASELIARAGSGSAFKGKTLGVGGLDDVLSEIQRRVWIPLAAPPTLLRELGIQPVRGLLLYGSPGCGKTLLARKLGSILSPARPITIVSGPEILDKFVGSSEKNLREIFDNPPELYFNYKKNYGDGLANAALHVIVLDEFDAIARARGGVGGGGDQGDAGVARDSVVNQLLAKMDGVSELGVPTLLIGLTNKPSLIDPALMRPGRFEVQINVPKPKTVAQRVSSGRLVLLGLLLRSNTHNTLRSRLPFLKCTWII